MTSFLFAKSEVKIMDKGLHDFGYGDGLVPAHRHPNGGGWVSDEATVHPAAYISSEAVVIGRASLCPDVILRDHTSIIGNVTIKGKALMEDNSRIIDNVQIDGDVSMSGYSLLEDDAKVEKNAVLVVSRHASMRGDAIVIEGTTKLDGMAIITGGSRLSGDLFFADAISINAVLDDSPHMIIKGMLALDFILDNKGVIWFCVEGMPLRFNAITCEYDNDLKSLLCDEEFELIYNFRESFLKTSHQGF